MTKRALIRMLRRWRTIRCLPHLWRKVAPPPPLSVTSATIRRGRAKGPATSALSIPFSKSTQIPILEPSSRLQSGREKGTAMSSSAGTASKGIPVSVAAVKAKPATDGSAKGKGMAIPDVKKKMDGLGKPVIKQTTVNVAVKPEGKTSANSSKSVTKVTKGSVAKGRSQKKAYSLHGQKYDPPEEREPLRIFYESLSKQIPSSEMAEFWMMEHGLLSPERAKKAYERKQRRQKQLRMGTQMKSAKTQKPESSKRPQLAKNDFSVKKKIKL